MDSRLARGALWCQDLATRSRVFGEKIKSLRRSIRELAGARAVLAKWGEGEAIRDVSLLTDALMGSFDPDRVYMRSTNQAGEAAVGGL